MATRYQVERRMVALEQKLEACRAIASQGNALVTLPPPSAAELRLMLKTLLEAGAFYPHPDSPDPLARVVWELLSQVLPPEALAIEAGSADGWEGTELADG